MKRRTVLLVSGITAVALMLCIHFVFAGSTGELTGTAELYSYKPPLMHYRVTGSTSTPVIVDRIGVEVAASSEAWNPQTKRYDCFNEWADDENQGASWVSVTIVCDGEELIGGHSYHYARHSTLGDWWDSETL